MTTQTPPPTPEEQLPDERPQRRREYSGAGSTLGVAVAIIALVALAIWWFEFRGDDSNTIADDGTGIIELGDGQNPTSEAPASERGRAAPNFRLANLDGQQVELTDYRGKWVLLNFWASWCGPCRQETPDLQALTERAGENLVVVGINQQETREAAADFTSEFGVTYPIVLDRNGEVSIAYRVGRGIPISMLVRPDGVIEEMYFGPLRDEQISALEAEYLG